MAKECPKCQFENTSDSKFCKECGTQLPDIKDIEVTETLETPKEELTTGSTFAGRYQIIEELGRGGMGRVYKATDTKISEKVALKLIKPEIASDKKTLERFANELKIARKIIHKNVGRMYDINEEKGTHYITMEYVSGQDLKGFIRQSGQMGVGTAISIIKQVCDGLSEAHKEGVTHRDLKPSNIMIDKEGNVRIMDFGIARSLKEKGITGAGVIIGTPEYMSPEQAEAKEVDQLSDIYSLGVILYEMATGRVPFEGDTALSIAMKHKSEVPKNPKEYNTQIPDDLNALILRCMEKDKDKRFQTAEEILSELTKIEKAIPILPKKPVTVSPTKPRIAVLPFKDISPQKDQDYFCDGLAEELINALTHIKGLDVVAQFSAFSFKGKDADIHDICRTLNVESVLGGSVRKSGNRLRVVSYLVNSDGSQLWSQKYEGEMKEVFAIQDDISQAIVNKLKINLMGEEQAAIQKRPTENLEAYDLYLKGIYCQNKVHPDELRKGIEYFQEAIEKDPNFALAYVEMGNIYAGFALLGISSPNDVFPKAKAELKKAMEIDDSLGEAYTLAANISVWYDWDWSAAEENYKKALALNPGLDSTHNMYSMFLLTQGRFDEAVTEIRLAQELNPLNPDSYAWGILIYRSAGRVDEAMEQIQKAMEVDPNSPMVLFHASWVYLTRGMIQEAIAALQNSYELSGKTFQWAHCGLGVAFAIAGQRDKAEEVLQELLRDMKSGFIPCMSIANNYFALGDEEKAWKWVEAGYKQHDFLMPLLGTWPEWEFLRLHPRGQAILKKMNLE